MKYFVQIMAGCGIATFLVGVVMKIMSAGPMLNAESIGWWRASMALLSIGILYALIEIRDELRKR